MALKEYNMDEVRKHTSRHDCWIVVNNLVLDVSMFLHQHPGGDRVLLEVGGTNATSKFVNAGHTSNMSKRLFKEYTIGRLVDERSTLMPPPPQKSPARNTNTLLAPAAPQNRRRKKVPLGAGYSAMDWMRLRRNMQPSRYRRIPMEEVQMHNTRDDVWIVLRGEVYDVTSYLKFHPGGVNQLMRAAGGDATVLFNETHSWVNYTFLLERCLVGKLLT